MSVGIGIELGRTVLRSVVLDLEDPAAIAASEFPIDIDDDESVVDALVRSTKPVDSTHGGSIPTRLASAPADLLVQAVDVTGRRRHEIVALADEAARLRAADSMMIVDDGRRRRLGLVRGHADSVERLTDLAHRAGLSDVRVEPAPIALGRVLRGGRVIARRNVDATSSWQAVFDHGFPIAATPAPTGLAGWPGLSTFTAAAAHDDPERILDADELTAHVDEFAEHARSRHRTRSPLDVDGWPVSAPTLTLGTQRHPSFPDHDLRATGRLGVALGAAAGAAGAAEPHLRVERLSPLHRPGQPTRLPWALELVLDHASTDEPSDEEPVADLRPLTGGRRARRTTNPTRDRRVSRRYRRSR